MVSLFFLSFLFFYECRVFNVEQWPMSVDDGAWENREPGPLESKDSAWSLCPPLKRIQNRACMDTIPMNHIYMLTLHKFHNSVLRGITLNKNKHNLSLNSNGRFGTNSFYCILLLFTEVKL